MALFILMGVSGSGKTTIGRAVAQQQGISFFEGDDYHPPANIAKMSAGIPLEDSDRVQWIDDLIAAVNAIDDANVIVACSALTRMVRARVTAQSIRPVHFVHLVADASLIQRRLDERGQHFMKPGMLGSQLAALEPPQEAFAVDASKGIEDVCRAVGAHVQQNMS